MAREEVQHNSGELSSPAALCKEDGVGWGDFQLGPDAIFEGGEKRDKLLGAMREFGDTNAGIIKVE